MPVDPRLWAEAPLSSSYPACMAVKAARSREPDAPGRYLRALREGLMCFRRKLDTVEALVEEARARRARRAALPRLAGVERDRGGVRRGSGGDALGGGDGAALGALRRAVRGRVVFGKVSYEEWRAAAWHRWARLLRARPLPDPLAAVGRFGRAATVEVATICDLAGPARAAELWGLAAELAGAARAGAHRDPVGAGRLTTAASTRCTCAVLEDDLSVSEAKRRQAGGGVRLVAQPIASLLSRRPVVAQAIGLDHQPSSRPEEIDAKRSSRAAGSAGAASRRAARSGGSAARARMSVSVSVWRSSSVAQRSHALAVRRALSSAAAQAARDRPGRACRPR